MLLINELADQLNNAQNLAKEKGKEAFKEYSLQLFNENPIIQEIRWDQYTPSFNDGDPCEFTIGDVGFLLHNKQTIGYYDFDEDDEFEGTKVEQHIEDHLKNIVNEFTNKIQALDTVMESLFGNNVTIIINRDGVQIKEYDCGY